MKKVFLYKDEANIYRNIETAKGFLSSINPFFTRYKELGLPDMKTENLKEFIMNPKIFFVKILTDGETLKIGQLELNPQKVYDLFPLPDGVNDLVIEIQSFTNQTNGHYLHQMRTIGIVENELCICEKYAKEIEDNHTFHTQTEDQNTALNLLKRIATDITSLRALKKKDFQNPQNWINECLIESKTENGINYTEKLEKIRFF